jgi:Tol biopolymer transport system component
LKKRLFSLLLLFICSWLGLFISCGLLNNDDDGGKIKVPTPVSSAEAIPAWSPDGQWIAIAWVGYPTVVPGGIYFIRPDGSDLHLVFTFGDFGYIDDLCWAPDGEWLALNAFHEIWKVKSNGDSLTRLTYSGENYTCTWSFSDTLIAYRHDIGYSPGIWLMDTNGNNQVSFIRNGGHFDFGPGDSLFYELSIGQGTGQMALINISDSTERVFYTMVAGKPYTTYYYPDFSPDGKKVVLSIDSRIRKLTTEGTDLQTLTTDGGSYPHWSPDGNYIVYCETDSPGFKVKIMRSDGSDKRLLIDFVDLLPDSLR